MKNRPKIGLIALLLLGGTLGWWLLPGGDKSSAPPVDLKEVSSQPASETAPPQPGNVAFHDVEVIEGEAAGNMMVATDPFPVVEEESQMEILARSIAEMGIVELTNRVGELTIDEQRGELGRLLIRRWAELDLAAAAGWTRELSDAQACNELSAAVALVWSERDLPGALDWGLSMDEGETQDRVLTELGYEMAREDPAESMRLAVALPAGDARDGMLLHALRQWASQSPEESQQWALNLSPGPLREQALAAVATVMANQDGERAARFAVEHVPPGLEQDRAVIGVIQRWAQVGYDQTAAWVELFPQTPLRHTALSVMADIAGSNMAAPTP